MPCIPVSLQKCALQGFFVVVVIMVLVRLGEPIHDPRGFKDTVIIYLQTNSILLRPVLVTGRSHLLLRREQN